MEVALTVHENNIELMVIMSLIWTPIVHCGTPISRVAIFVKLSHIFARLLQFWTFFFVFELGLGKLSCFTVYVQGGRNLIFAIFVHYFVSFSVISSVIIL